MNRLIPVFLLAAMMLKSCGGGDGSNTEKNSTAEPETTAAAVTAVTTDTETQSTAAVSDSRTKQTAASAASSAAKSTTGSETEKHPETPADGSFSEIRPDETTAEDEHVIIVTVPDDSPSGNDTDGIIIKDGESLLLPSVEHNDIN